jgi:hypothetical protein
MVTELRDVAEYKPKQITDKQRRAKRAKIGKPEASYENLLKDKEFHLARASEPLEDVAGVP